MARTGGEAMNTTPSPAIEAVEQTPMVHQCCGRLVCDGTDCPNKGPWYKVPAWRMSGYYYSFDATGLAAIDRILSAVGCAGKAYHHTEDWNEEASARDNLRGNTPVEWIQNAAIDAAALLAAKQEEVDKMRAALGQFVSPFDGDSMDEIEAQYGLGTAQQVDNGRKALGAE